MQGLLYCKDSIYGFSGRLKTISENTNLSSEANSDLVTFAGGQLDTGSGDIQITGTYAPSTTISSDNANGISGLTLSHSNLNLSQQTAPGDIKIGSGQTVSLSGSPVLKNAISLTDSSSTLNLNMTNKINQDILLNDGTVVLNEDAAFKDGTGFIGNGTVDINNRTLYRSAGSVQTGNICFKRANDIQFTGDQSLSGATTTFTGIGGTSLVNGNGYTWLLSNAATIKVDPNHHLYLTDIRIKGLGNTSADGIFDIDPTSTISLANVTLEQNTTYSSSAGTISVDGDNCKLIPHGNTFTVTGANSRMIINGVALLYEPLDFTDQSPFFFTDLTQNIIYNNNGITRTAKAGGGEFPIKITGNSYTLMGHQRLTTTNTISTTNATPGTPKAVSIDGAGYSITFPRTSGSFFVISPNTQVTITNCSLKDYNPAAISFADANASLSFGDNVYIEFGSNIVLAGGERALAATGNATILGGKNSLTLNSASQLTVTGAKTFTIKNLDIYTKNSSSIACLTSTASISLENVNLIPDNNGLTISGGSLLVNGACKVRTLHPSSTGQIVNFTFASPSIAELFYVMSKSSLEIAPDTNFVHSTGNKFRFKLQDPSSTLILNACNMNTGTGLALNYGKVIVDNLVKITASTTTGQELELGSGLDLQIMSAGILQIDGLVKYTSTTFP